MATTLVHIEPATLADDAQIRVPFRIESAGNSLIVGGAVTFPVVDGVTAITDTGDRVYAETAVDGLSIISGKLDPGDPSNAFAVLRAETACIEPLTLPVTTDDIEAVAAVVHAYVVNGRPEW